MKKNILTIIIMAIVLINTVLTGVLIFVIVPTSNRTTQIVNKVASIVDLELEDPDASNSEITVTDIASFDVPDKLTINLASSGDGTVHYALISNITLSLNSKHKDYKDLDPKMTENVNKIKEIIREEVAKYTFEDVSDKQDDIKKAILTRIQELFQSDFIIDVSFGDLVLS